MRSVRRILSVSLAVSFALFALSACGNTGITDSAEEEIGEITGMLHIVREDSMTIDNANESVIVQTDGDTKYYLGEDDNLSFDDIVKVQYHIRGSEKYAERVTVVRYAAKDLMFSGEIVGTEKEGITVSSGTMTAFFTVDDGTEVAGKLKKGNKVDVTYTGDISESPHATKIKVTDEKKENKTAVINGTISDFTKDAIQITIDSATSYRIKLNKDTKFTGVSKYMNTGDSVRITYEGNLKKDAVATEVKILKKVEIEIRKVNGTIERITDKYVVLKTDGNSYIINTDEKTKYTGDKISEGSKAEITYTGKLVNKPVATAIYCVNKEEKTVFYKVTFEDGQGKVIKEQQIEKGKSATAPANPSREGYTFKGWDKDFSKITDNLKVKAQWIENAKPAPESATPDPESTPEEEPAAETDSESGSEAAPDSVPEPEPTPEEEVIVSAKGLIDDGDEEKMTIKIEIEGEIIELKGSDDTKIASGYFPAKGDKVEVKYTKSDLTLKEIKLIEKAPEETSEEPAKEDAASDEKSENKDDANGDAAEEDAKLEDDADGDE